MPETLNLAPAVPDPRLTVRFTERVLRVARAGRLQPWLGPALRGLAGGRLKAQVCRHSVADQLTTWRYCARCPHQAGCAYGETLEPDAPAGVKLASGWESTARPLVVAPACPAPEFGRVGDLIPVRVTLIGQAAAAHAEAVWEALRLGGADPGLGLGDDRVPFDLLPPADPADADRWAEVALPADPAAVPGQLPWVRVVLTSPLILNEHAPEGGKRLVLRPTFSDLLRAALRVLGPLFRCYATPLPEESFGRVKDLSAGVGMLAGEFHEYGQMKASHRSGDRWEVRGVVGAAEYGPVPMGLLPWLEWAGRLHVGTHRVAGAGGWSVERA